MSEDGDNKYTNRGWWRDLRENGMAHSSVSKSEAKPSWKSNLWLGAAFIGLGLLKVIIFKDGLLEWFRVINMSYEEVSQTPYLPIWTSGRAIAGIIFF